MRRLMCCIVTLAAMAMLTGCGKDEQKIAADAIDNANSAIQDALENAPTGSEIVSGINEVFQRGRENNSGIISGMFE